MSSRSVFARYLLLQVPGWALALLVLALLRFYLNLPFAAAAALFSLWVIKDLVLFPLLRSAYEQDDRPVIARLIGEEGAAVHTLAPGGYVRVRGELWRAEVRGGQPQVAAGQTIVVTAVRDSVLLVEPRAATRRAS